MALFSENFRFHSHAYSHLASFFLNTINIERKKKTSSHLFPKHSHSPASTCRRGRVTQSRNFARFKWHRVSTTSFRSLGSSKPHRLSHKIAPRHRSGRRTAEGKFYRESMIHCGKKNQGSEYNAKIPNFIDKN